MIGDKIKLLREELGLKQEDLAKKLNLSSSAIGMYETNKRQPNYDILIKLSDFFDVSIDYILCRTDIRNLKRISDSDKIQISLPSKSYNSLTISQKKDIEELTQNVVDGIVKLINKQK